MRFKITLWFLACLFVGSAAFAQQGGLFDLSGKPISYNEVTAKEKTILFLWSTTCPYCIEDLRKFNRDSFEGYDAQVYLINMGDDPEVVHDFAASMGFKDSLKEHILMDPNLVLSEKFTVVGVPTIIFLRNGKPIYTTYTLDKDLVKEVYSKK